MFKIYNSYKNLTIENQLTLIKNVFGYIPEFKNRISKKCKNTLRGDKKADCYFIINKNNKIKFYDFADSFYWNLSITDIISKIYCLNYRETLDYISNILDGNSISISMPKLEDFEKPIIKVVTKQFSKEGKEYWKNFGIDISKYKHLIKELESYYIEKNHNIKKTDCSTLTFTYIFNNENVKIYSPFERKDRKFKGSVTKNDIFGYSEMNDKEDYVIITKSFKDWLILHNLGFNAIALQSESQIELPEFLLKNLNNKKVYLLFDNDEAGINNAMLLTNKYNFKSIFYPNLINNNKPYKDTADMYVSEGKEFIINFINNAIR
jgi:hypothetical protein